MAKLFGVTVKRSFDPTTGKCDLIEPRYPGFIGVAQAGVRDVRKMIADMTPKHPDTYYTLIGRAKRVARWRKQNKVAARTRHAQMQAA